MRGGSSDGAMIASRDGFALVVYSLRRCEFVVVGVGYEDSGEFSKLAYVVAASERAAGEELPVED